MEVNFLRVLAHVYAEALLRAFRSYRRYLLFAAMLLTTCIMVGYRGFNPSADSLPWIFDNLVKLRDSMAGASELEQMAMLFWNNLKSTLISIGLGWIFGIIPMVSICLNGVIIGAGAKLMVAKDALPMPIVIASFLQHGVLELPAFLAGQIVGLRLGFLIPVVWRGRASRDDLGRAAAEGAIILGLFCLPLLAIAAVVELKVTPAIIRALAPHLSTLPL
jgi:stage II sporulation protein M